MPHQFMSAAILALIVTTACQPGQRPLVMIQLCLEDAQGVAEFKELIRDVAADQRLEYIDNSQYLADSIGQLAAASPGLDGLEDVSTRIDVWAFSDTNSHGLSAGNLGLTSYEVAIGFNGRNFEEVNRLASLVVMRLSETWAVTALPPDTGAFPLENCANGRAEK